MYVHYICAVKLRVLGLMAYWYTGSAFHQISQSYSYISIQTICTIIKGNNVVHAVFSNVTPSIFTHFNYENIYYKPVNECK